MCKKLQPMMQTENLTVPELWLKSCLALLSRLVTKPTKWHMRPAKTQISLGTHTVWSESSLSAWKKLRSLATHWAHSEDSDQTGWMPRLIWVFAGCTCHFVGFVVRRLFYPSCFLVKVFSVSLFVAIYKHERQFAVPYIGNACGPNIVQGDATNGQ